MKVLITVGILLFLSGCTGVKVSQIPVPDCEHAVCWTEIKGSVDISGGGRYGAAGLTLRDKDGRQMFKPIVDGVYPDRFDTLMPSTIMAFGQYQAARTHAQAIEKSSRRQGPQVINVNNVEGGDAMAVNETSVDVDQTLKTPLPQVHWGGPPEDGGH